MINPKHIVAALAALTLASTSETACARIYGEGTVAQPFDLSAVSVESPTLLHVRRLALDYLMGLDADRLLAPYFKEAGLKPLADNYPNWENTGLDGHIGGHYLSALAHMYAATGDARVKERLYYMVSQLAKAQASDGYLSGVPGGREMWTDLFSGHIDAGAFSLNGKWVPLYNIHKVMAGLRDAYKVGKCEEAKLPFINLCSWFEANAAKLSQEQIQQMLVSEHGGLNEIMADAYEMTGEHSFLKMARALTHTEILNPLLDERDNLTGIHANTQIPKIIGVMKIAEVDHDDAWRKAADFFWKTVTENRSVSIGGNSVREHFHPADDFSSMLESEQGPETCNTYNMLRLTKMLFLTKPDAAYTDFYERAMLNHILSTINTVQGGFVYFTPMRPGHYRVYSQPQTSFWCCVGSGLENHSRYGEMIFAHSGKTDLYVNTFIPSTLNWSDNKAQVSIDGDFPWTETANITVKSRKPKKWTLKVRKPQWSDGFTLSIDGKTFSQPDSDGYISITREWGSADVVKVNMPMKLQSSRLPDGSDFYSVSYGPMVLAADLGRSNQPGLYADESRGGHIAFGPKMDLSDLPTLVADDDILSHIRRVGDEWKWTVDCTQPSKYASLELVPFVNLSEHRYQVYFRALGQKVYADKMEQLRIIDEARRALEARTVDVVICGEQQPETDHAFAHGSSFAGGTDDNRHWRETDSWFSYEVKTAGAKAISLTYMQMPGRSAVILCGNSTIEIPAGDEGLRTIEMPIAEADKSIVKIAAKESSSAGEGRSPRIFEVRAVR